MSLTQRLERFNSTIGQVNLVLFASCTTVSLLLMMVLNITQKQQHHRKLDKPQTVTVAAAALMPHTHVDDKYCLAVLTKKKHVSRDTMQFEFEYQDDGKTRILPVGKHLKVFAPNPAPQQEMWNGRVNEERHALIERKYTPCVITPRGFVLVVKIYSKTPQFPDGGKMTQYLSQLRVGDLLECAFPYGLIEYAGSGVFKKSRAQFPTQHVGMVAGGSGLTPMLRLLEESLHRTDDNTKFSLLFANRDEGDIILKERLDELAAKFPERFKLSYILSRPSDEWQGVRGYITKEVLQQALPPVAETTLVLVCGPPVMINGCVKENLQAMGFTTKQVWDF